jgi:hypothetical protein
MSSPASKNVDQAINFRTWRQACAKHGLKFVAKSDARYEEVRKTYELIHPDRAAREAKKSEQESNPRHKLWQKCCEELKIQYPKKGTPEYDQVMTLFSPLAESLENDDSTSPPLLEPQETEVSWADCCAELGYKFARKGTAEYDQVRALFDSKKSKVAAV